MLTLPAHATASQLLDPSDFKRLMLAALSALEELARTAANPIERRRAATTLLRALTARPPAPPKLTSTSPTRPTAPQLNAAPAPSPLMPPPRAASPPIAHGDSTPAPTHSRTPSPLLRAHANPPTTARQLLQRLATPPQSPRAA